MFRIYHPTPKTSNTSALTLLFRAKTGSIADRLPTWLPRLTHYIPFFICAGTPKFACGGSLPQFRHGGRTLASSQIKFLPNSSLHQIKSASALSVDGTSSFTSQPRRQNVTILYDEIYEAMLNTPLA
jgi:hypothetical protein